MGRGAWRATLHGVARVGRDLATKLNNNVVYVTVMKVFGPRLKFVITAKFCELTGFLF